MLHSPAVTLPAPCPFSGDRAHLAPRAFSGHREPAHRACSDHRTLTAPGACADHRAVVAPRGVTGDIALPAQHGVTDHRTLAAPRACTGDSALPAQHGVTDHRTLAAPRACSGDRAHLAPRAFSGHRALPAALMVLLAVALLPAAPLHASERPFTFVYEATTMPKGAREYETWVTWKTHKESDPDFDRFDFRHEFEFGVTDRFQLALYVSDWRYEDGASVSDDGTDWRNAAVEGIYQLTNPTTDPLGVALYGEIKGGDELFELESKLLLQKNVGPWILAWNGTLEAEWEGSDYSEDKGKLAQAAGISYGLSPRWAVGAELIHEIEYEDWSAWGDHVVYLGPAVSYRAPRWWVTVTPTVQLTDVDSEADFQTRLILAIDF